MANPSPFSPALSSDGVHLVGDFHGDTALCGIARDMSHMLKGMGVPVEELDLPFSPGRQIIENGKHTLGQIPTVLPKSGLSLICWNGDVNPLLATSLPKNCIQGRRLVGMWYWETEILPPALAQGYDLMDEVWVTSRFIAESLSKSAPVPIRHFPHLLKAPHPPSQLQLPEALRGDRFMFLFCFDFRSVAKRKNPHGTCEAFVKAFPSVEPGGPVCVIKSLAGYAHHRLEYAELVQRYAHRPDILFIDGWVSAEERDSLMQRADCYVSLHRAEGLGLTMMECMSLGKPCIATAYSGNMDFTDDANSWLIPFYKTRIGGGAWPYPPGHEWAEPDTEAAARAMQEAVKQPSLLAEKGRLSRETMLRNHGLEAVGSRLVALIEDLLTREPREKPALTPTPDPKHSRKKVAQMLKESRAMHRKAQRQCDKLRGLFLPSEVKDILQSLLKTISLQHEAHLATLQELNRINSRLQIYQDVTFSGLVKHQELATNMLTQQLPPPPRTPAQNHQQKA